MRKRRRLPAEELAPYVVELPAAHPRRRPPPGGAAAPAAASPDAAGTAAPPGRPLDWRELFGNDHPVEVEVGFGKGLFLLNAATTRPDRNFFGVEIARKYQLYAATRLAVRKLPNVKTCCADAKAVLLEHVRPGSVAVVHVYFPDPWWKSRHKKRLLFTPDFAAAVERVLAPGGELHFATDVADYFDMVTATLAAFPGLERLPPPPPGEPAHDMDYLTNFERKFRKQGKPIYRAVYRRAEPAGTRPSPPA